MFWSHTEQLKKATGKKMIVRFLLWKKQHSSYVLGDSYLNNIKAYQKKKANKQYCCKKVVIYETETSFPIFKKGRTF